MLSTILTESCFTQAHTPVTLLLVAQGPIVQLGNTTQILTRAAALTPEPAIWRQLVHLTSQFAQNARRLRTVLQSSNVIRHPFSPPDLIPASMLRVAVACPVKAPAPSPVPNTLLGLSR